MSTTPADPSLPLRAPPLAPPIAPPPQLLPYMPAQIPTCPAGWTNVRVLGLLPEGLSGQLHRRLAIQFAIRLAFILILGGYCYWLYHSLGIRMTLYSMGFLMVLMVAASMLGAWRTVRRARREWLQFRLLLSDQGIQRTLPGYPDMVITNQQITSVREAPAGLIVRTARRLHVMCIFRATEQFADIRAHLAQVHPITPYPWMWLRGLLNILLGVLLAAAGIILYSIGAVAQGLPVELSCLAAVCIIWGWSIALTCRNPNLPLSRKLLSLIVLLFPIILAAKILAAHTLLRK